jgi:hypothetical protein
MPDLTSGNVRVFYGAEAEAYAQGVTEGTRREREHLRPVLADALQGLVAMTEYVAPYFWAKYGFGGYVDRAREALASLDGEPNG